MTITRYATVVKEVEFDAGHRVHQHKSKCRNLHGHRYRVRAAFQGPVEENDRGTDSGMVLDFGDIKEALVKYIHDHFDHKLVLYTDDPFWVWMQHVDSDIVRVEWIPTAENFAIFCYETLISVGLPCMWVEVYETPTSVARYEGHEVEVPNA